VPVNFEHDHLGEILLEAIHMKEKKTLKSFQDWKKMARGVKNHSKHQVAIGVVGKYFNTGDFILSDSYISVLEAIKFSAYENGVKAVIHSINARDFEAKDPDYSVLDGLDGIIVPGGFGETGIEGKLNVIEYARKKKIPYFGLCYGMQLMTIEFARNVLRLKGAHTAEIDPKSPHLVIDVMPDQKKLIAEGKYGGSMRLGIYKAKLTKGTIAEEAYGRSTIEERHRHRYEVNPKYVERLAKGGLIFSGRSLDGVLMEIAELPRAEHPFFLGTQFHPELLARPLSPHPLFTAFMKASKARNKEAGREAEGEEVLAKSKISIKKELFA
jgi:CTP synthase